MVVRETQRAFVYFSLHGLTVDRIIVNRVLPPGVGDGFFSEWHRSQEQALAEIEEYFAPVPVVRVPLSSHEVVGRKRLAQLAEVLYSADDDPSATTRLERPYTFATENGHHVVRLRVPFASKADVGLFKKGDELVVQIGTLRRHIGLPTSMARFEPARARLEDGILTVELKEAS